MSSGPKDVSVKLLKSKQQTPWEVLATRSNRRRFRLRPIVPKTQDSNARSSGPTRSRKRVCAVRQAGARPIVSSYQSSNIPRYRPRPVPRLGCALALHADDLLEPVDDLYEVALCLHHGVDVLIGSGSLVENLCSARSRSSLDCAVFRPAMVGGCFAQVDPTTPPMGASAVNVGGRRVTPVRVLEFEPDFERRSSFVDAGWAEFWHRTGFDSAFLEKEKAHEVSRGIVTNKT